MSSLRSRARGALRPAQVALAGPRCSESHMRSRHCFNPRAGGALSLLVLASLASLAGCSNDVAPPALDQSWSGVCIDGDGDGYGFQCGTGDDCDDRDSTLNVDCGCKRPEQGCGCDEGSAPEACQLPHAIDATGALI